MRAWSLAIGLATLACVRPPAGSRMPGDATRLPILGAEYGGSSEHPAAIGPGDRIETLALPLADGGSFELADAQTAGPVVLVFVGGAEHEPLIAWIRDLDRALALLEQRSATLVLVRPLEPDAALRWAIDLHLQTPVVGDPHGELARLLDADRSQPGSPGVKPAPLEFAVLILDDHRVVYRKLGGRRPELVELLAVLDGEAERLRCCPGSCEGPACR